MLRPSNCIDGSDSEAVGGEWLEATDTKDCDIVRGLKDVPVTVPHSIFTHADVDEVVGDRGVVSVQWGSPRQVHRPR
jgi:hypothetical protein